MEDASASAGIATYSYHNGEVAVKRNGQQVGSYQLDARDRQRFIDDATAHGMERESSESIWKMLTADAATYGLKVYSSNGWTTIVFQIGSDALAGQVVMLDEYVDQFLAIFRDRDDVTIEVEE